MVLVGSQVNPDSNASELLTAFVFVVCFVAIGVIFISRWGVGDSMTFKVMELPNSLFAYTFLYGDDERIETPAILTPWGDVSVGLP
jgi:hypothetical protein